MRIPDWAITRSWPVSLGLECLRAASAASRICNWGSTDNCPQRSTAAALAGADRSPAWAGAAAHSRRGGAGFKTVGWCTGAAQSYIDAGGRHGTGCLHQRRDFRADRTHRAGDAAFIILRPGIMQPSATGCRRWGSIWRAHFGISHQFIDIDNPSDVGKSRNRVSKNSTDFCLDSGSPLDLVGELDHPMRFLDAFMKQIRIFRFSLVKSRAVQWPEICT